MGSAKNPLKIKEVANKKGDLGAAERQVAFNFLRRGDLSSHHTSIYPCMSMTLSITGVDNRHTFWYYSVMAQGSRQPHTLDSLSYCPEGRATQFFGVGMHCDYCTVCTGAVCYDLLMMGTVLVVFALAVLAIKFLRK